ncbi:MAG: enoyl-CoA hydratase-related protein [Burkholderiaceae bacterium]
MEFKTIRSDIDHRGVATLSLARPEVHNAMNGEMYDEARAVVRDLAADASVRLLVLTAEGKTFCSGGDLRYQQQQRSAPRQEKLHEARKLALWLREIDALPFPVIGRINGPAYAGGLGLISVCDIAIGLRSARFAITEARLGLVPGMISPFVVRRIGVPNARRLILSARMFSGTEAVRYGLLQEAVAEDELDQAVEAEIELILKCAPQAVATCKRLIDYVSQHDSADNLIYTVDRVADMWESPEAIEGMASFIEKRAPAWAVKENG